jgi:pimeloyl-ACP methyl ester carboxylesterase
MAVLGIEQDWLALPGIPAGSGVWEQLPVRTLDFQGVQDATHRPSWALQSFVDETLPHYDQDTILIGHDLGGVVAAMSAVQKSPKAVVLTGTALGHWWFWTRLSAAPMLNRFFYHTFKGNLFVRLGGGRNTGRRFANQPHFHDPTKMKRLALHMKPPTGLVEKLKTTCPVFIIWGRREVFYPGFLAKSMAHRLDAPLYWNDGGHYCMWTHAEDVHQSMQEIERRLLASFWP